MTRLFAISCWIAAPIALAGGPDAGVPRLLIDTRLQERQVTLLGFDETEVRFLDAAGLERTELLANLVAITPQHGAPSPATPAVAVWFTDGQRIGGAPRTGESDAEHILWRHPALGPLDIPLDDISRVTLRKPRLVPASRPSDTEDVLTLVNGDRLSGFLESFGSAIRIEVEGASRDISARRVAEIALANPPAPAAGLRIWLADGSIVTAASLRSSESGEVLLTPAVAQANRPTITEASDEMPVSALSLADVVAVVFDAAAIVPLSSLEPGAQRPLADRRWAEPVERLGSGVVGAADLVLPGPMAVEWTLPEGSSRLATEAELTPDLWAWGDCELVVSVVAASGRVTEIRRDRINAERPRIPINVSVTESSARLRLSLEPGQYGSIQDRIILRRPLILLEPGPG